MVFFGGNVFYDGLQRLYTLPMLVAQLYLLFIVSPRNVVL